MIVNEGAVLGGVPVLDLGDPIGQLGCDASYAVMASVEDEQADACEAGLGATPCSERPAGLIAYVIEPEPAVGEEGVDDSDGEGIELTALCGLPAVVSEGGDAASQLLDPEIAEEEGSVDPSGEAVVGHAEQSPGFKRGIWQRLSSRERLGEEARQIAGAFRSSVCGERCEASRRSVCANALLQDTF